MNEEIIVGDRVAIAEPAQWCQPIREYGKTGKLATVESVFTPLGSNEETYRVRFDLKSYKYAESGVYLFRRHAIKKAEQDS